MTYLGRDLYLRHAKGKGDRLLNFSSGFDNEISITYEKDNMVVF
jgi:hypothetical protein